VLLEIALAAKLDKIAVQETHGTLVLLQSRNSESRRGRHDTVLRLVGGLYSTRRFQPGTVDGDAAHIWVVNGRAHLQGAVTSSGLRVNRGCI
jgi:hypothetical protein